MATVLPTTPVTLSPEQVQDLHEKLRKMRHDINNYLTVIVGYAEMIRLKPEASAQFITGLTPQPPKIEEAMSRFSKEVEQILEVRRTDG